jgi:hypothetical protein
MAPFLTTDHRDAGRDCQYALNLYPTIEFQEPYETNQAAIVTGIVVSIFLAGVIIFCAYDLAVHSRQRRILAIAAQSERILSVLYPKQIRDRLFGFTEMIGVGVGGGGATPTASTGPDTSPNNEQKHKRKHHHHHRHKNKMFDATSKSHQPTKQRLKSFINEDGASGHTESTGGGDVLESKPIADLFPHTTVLFADIAGFTAWSRYAYCSGGENFSVMYIYFFSSSNVPRFTVCSLAFVNQLKYLRYLKLSIVPLISLHENEASSR